MKLGFVLSLMLLVSAACLQAQDRGKSNRDTSMSGEMEGCLQTSMGNYMLTGKDGTTMELVGAARKLGKLVGHHIQVTGVAATRTSDTTQVSGASSAVERRVFEVKTVKDMGNGCSQ